MNDKQAIDKKTAEKIRNAYCSQEWDYKKTAEIFDVDVKDIESLCKYGDEWKGYEAWLSSRI